MKKSPAAFAALKLVFFALLAVGLLAASCGSDSSDSSSDTADAPATTVVLSEASGGEDGASDGEDGSSVTTSSPPATSPPATSATAVTSPPETTTTLTAEFPVTITDQMGEVTIDARPERIVSLSATATEMLFAVGAGDQVVAVDSFSNYPPEAPTTDLSGFQPNIEAIATYEPDLVLISFDPGGLVDGLKALGADVIVYSAAATLDDAYDQMEAIGAATGHSDEAVEATADIERSIEEITSSLDLPSEPFTYFPRARPHLLLCDIRHIHRTGFRSGRFGKHRRCRRRGWQLSPAFGRIHLGSEPRFHHPHRLLRRQLGSGGRPSRLERTGRRARRTGASVLRRCDFSVGAEDGRDAGNRERSCGGRVGGCRLKRLFVLSKLTARLRVEASKVAAAL